VIDHHEKLNTLSRKTRSGHDPPSVMLIPLTMCSKFDVSRLVLSYSLSKINFRHNWGNSLRVLGSTKTLLLCTWYSLL